ncbi:MAG: nitrogen regulatory protein PII-like uncharacterized protein [Crocinitomix sp.]|jgi:nitrogen regulatory protein PII-like uncharacterized protein
MISVKVEYTVEFGFVEENKSNIQKVMEALQQQPIEGMYYSSQTINDSPNTFVHYNLAKDTETMSKLSELDEFKAFQKALKASKPLSPPQATNMTVVGVGF